MENKIKLITIGVAAIFVAHLITTGILAYQLNKVHKTNEVQGQVLQILIKTPEVGGLLQRELNKLK